MVTMDTVDDDIYEMQQRKTKMNAAILETGDFKVENEEIKSMLQNQLDRFLKPQRNSDELTTNI